MDRSDTRWVCYDSHNPLPNRIMSGAGLVVWGVGDTAETAYNVAVGEIRRQRPGIVNEGDILAVRRVTPALAILAAAHLGDAVPVRYRNYREASGCIWQCACTVEEYDDEPIPAV